MDMSHKIGLCFLLWSVIVICKASRSNSKAILISKFMNMTKFELQEFVEKRSKVRSNHHRKALTKLHRLNISKIAHVFERPFRRTIVGHDDEMTIEQMHKTANENCPCGAKPMVDVIFQVEFYYLCVHNLLKFLCWY